MLNQISKIAHMSLLIWVREISKIFRTTKEKTYIWMVISFLACFALGVSLALMTSAQINGANLPDELQRRIIKTSFGGAMMLSGIIATIFCLTTPTQTSLQNVISLLPVSNFRSGLGQTLPLLLITFFFSCSVSATSFVVIFKTGLPRTQTFFALALLIFAICFSIIFCISSFRLIKFLAVNIFKLPEQYGISVSGAVVIVISIAMPGVDIVDLSPRDDSGFSFKNILPHSSFASLVTNYSEFLAWSLIFFWLIAIFFVFNLSVSLPPGEKNDLVLSGLNIPAPKHGHIFMTLVWKNIIFAVRGPQFIMSIISCGALVMLSSWLSSLQILSNIGFSLAFGVASVPFILALYAVGRTLPSRWMVKFLSGSDNVWIFPGVFAYFFVGFLVAIPFVFLEIILDLIAARDLFIIILRAIMMLSIAIFSGAVIPCTRTQQMSVPAASFLAGIILLMTNLLLLWLSSLSEYSVYIFSIFFSIILFILYTLVARRQSMFSGEAVDG